MAPLLPIGSCKAHAIKFGSATVGSHVWGTNASPIKNREEGGPLTLDGCHLVVRHNNQPIVGGSNRRDVREEACWAGSAWGDTVQSFGVPNWTTKNYKI
jgi:hypothetical protein